MSHAGSLADEVAPGAIGPRDPDVDQLVVMHGVDWRTYGALRELIDSPGIRMTYLKGALEIMSPSRRGRRESEVSSRTSATASAATWQRRPTSRSRSS